MADQVDDPLAARVARVLALIAAPPGRRESPRPGDLDGDFHVWFDGGAWRDDTGSRSYVFADGTTAWMACLVPHLWLTIGFPDGRSVSVDERVARGADSPGTPQPGVVETCLVCGEQIAAGATLTLVGGKAFHAACAPIDERIEDAVAAHDYEAAIRYVLARLAGNSGHSALEIRLADLHVLAGRPTDAIPILLRTADALAADSFFHQARGFLRRVQKLEPSHPGIAARERAWEGREDR